MNCILTGAVKYIIFLYIIIYEELFLVCDWCILVPLIFYTVITYVLVTLCSHSAKIGIITKNQLSRMRNRVGSELYQHGS